MPCAEAIRSAPTAVEVVVFPFPLYFPPFICSLAEALETTKIHSVVAKLNSQAIIATRPFRSPHHTISAAGLVGGGTVPKRDEVSLAHKGVVFPYAMNYRNSGAQVLEMIGSL